MIKKKKKKKTIKKSIIEKSMYRSEKLSKTIYNNLINTI